MANELTEWRPFSDFAEIRHRLDQAFRDLSNAPGEHREEKEEKDEHFVRRERRYGSFSRSMVLPKGVKADDIEAKSEDGVLEVTIPMPEEEEKQTVEVQTKPKSD